MRKKKPEEPANHERWLISYADFITLLFAFFVVMFAISQVDSKQMGRFTVAFQKALGTEIFPGRGDTLLPNLQDEGKLGNSDANEGPDGGGSGPAPLPKELQRLKEALTALAQSNEALAGLNLLQRRNELVLRLSDSVFFDTGDDTLRDPARAMIHALAPELAKRSVDVRVEGHTDTRPISTVRFRSNWDLSTARATAVIAKLAAEGMQSPRLSAAGYGEFRPVADNATEEGRKLNRRVDLVVSVDMGIAPEIPLQP